MPFLLSRAVCAFVRFVTCCLFRTLQRVRFLPSFAVIVCAWVRLHACTLFEAVFLPFARLLLLLQYICPPCTLSRVYVACIESAFGLCNITVFLCSLRSENQRLRGAKDGSRGTKAPRRRGCVYSFRSPSASRCSFSATK